MSQAVGEAALFGIGVALSPLAVIAVVLMLAERGGRTGAVLFALVWAGALAAVATAALLLADGAGADDGGDPADWVVGLQILLGLALLVVAGRQWRGRGEAVTEDELPGWMQKVDGLSTGGAAAMAALIAVKPKNLLLSIGVAVAIAELGAEPGAQAAGVAAFVLVGTLAPGIPLAISLLMGERGPAALGSVRSWMVRESTTIVVLLCLVFAGKLLSDAVTAHLF